MNFRLPLLYFLILIISFHPGTLFGSDGCTPHSGKPSKHDGSGACAGNNFLSLKLRSLDLSMFYNSTWPQNRLGLGIGFTLDLMSFASLGKYPWYQSGDGTYVSLHKPMDGYFKGSWISEDRETLSDYLTHPESDTVWRYAMNGYSYRYDRLNQSEIFVQRAAIAPSGARSEFYIGKDIAHEYIKTPNAHYKLVRAENGVITISDLNDKSSYAVMVLDSQSRLVRIREFVKNENIITYEFSYWDSTHLIKSYEISSGSRTLKFNYIYDSKERLVSIAGPHSSEIRYTRTPIDNENLVKTYFANGLVREERFSNDKIVNTKQYFLQDPDKSFEDKQYVYFKREYCESDCYELLKIIEAGGRQIEFTYHPTNGLDSGFRIYEADELVESVEYKRNYISYLLASYKHTTADGKILEDSKFTYAEKRPYRLKRSYNAISGIYKDFAYPSPDITVVSHFNKFDFRYLKNTYQGDRLVTNEDFLNIDELRTTKYEYDPQGRLKTVTHGGKSIEYQYDDSHRLTYRKDQRGHEYWTKYTPKGDLASTRVRYTSGLETTNTLKREFHPDESVATLTDIHLYPKGRSDRLKKYSDNASGNELLESWSNGVLIYKK